MHTGIYSPLEEDAVSESRAAAMGGVTSSLNYMRTGAYYLNQATSLCVNTGSAPAVNFGMNTMTTDPAGTPDSGQVDMGYHYPIPPIPPAP